MQHEELCRLIRKFAYLEGDFVLRSGKRSRYYLDKYRFETQPAVLAELGRRLAEHCTPRTTHIAGAELGGVPLAAAAALASGLPFLIVRNAKKDYGTANVLEGLVPQHGTALVVEDVATTGGQILQAARDLNRAGITVEKIVAVLDRLEGAGENIEAAGYAFDALLTIEDLGIARSGN